MSLSSTYTHTRPRPLSRLSSGTSTLPSSASPPSSWSGMQAPYTSSSRTGSSVGGLSEEPTDGASGKESDLRTVVGWAGAGKGPTATAYLEDRERPLIDFGSDYEDHTPVEIPAGTRGDLSGPASVGMTPGDKLRMLLRQMEHEVMVATPIPQRSSYESGDLGHSADSLEAGGAGIQERLQVELRTSAWRSRRSQTRPASTQSPESSPDRRRLDAEEDSSPPTPPPRILNPYLNGTRRTSGNRQPAEADPPAARIPSRAAILQATPSMSPPLAAGNASREPTALEQYISSHRSPPLHFPRSPSHDRSVEQDRSVSSAGSRKGKERASPSLSSPPARAEPATQFVSPNRLTGSEHRHRGHTPRKWSVDIAPDDSLAFGMDAHSLEVQGEGELDMDEGASLAPVWECTDESELEAAETRYLSPAGSGGDRTAREASALGLGTPSPQHSPSSTSLERSRQRPHAQTQSASPARPQAQSGASPASSSSPHLSPNVSRARQGQTTRSRLSPMRPAGSHAHAHARNVSADTSLPPLPEPEGEAEADDEEDEEAEANTLSSRRAAMFRSTTKSPAASSPPIRQSQPAGSLPPVQVPVNTSPTKAKTRVATPQSRLVADNSVSGLMPHPPGRWTSPAKGVRFNGEPSRPLRADVSAELGDDVAVEERIVHRIKISPARPSPSSVSSRLRDTQTRLRQSVADTSFTGDVPMLIKSPSRQSPHTGSAPTLLPASTAMRDAQSMLLEASSRSARAQQAVEASQRQWLNALSTLQLPPGVGKGAVQAVRQGAGWGWWAWWLAIEGLLIFGVFRLTLDYATSASYLSNLDPFSLHHSARGGASYGLSVALPTAVSGFVVPHRGSVNFFDLLERVEVWKVFEALGIGGQPLESVAQGIRDGVTMLARVPS